MKWFISKDLWNRSAILYLAENSIRFNVKKNFSYFIIQIYTIHSSNMFHNIYAILDDT